jgi:hypothetical protein
MSTFDDLKHGYNVPGMPSAVLNEDGSLQELRWAEDGSVLVLQLNKDLTEGKWIERREQTLLPFEDGEEQDIVDEAELRVNWIYDRALGRRRCSFCFKSSEEVATLIAAPRAAFICNECIQVCGQILEEQSDS